MLSVVFKPIAFKAAKLHLAAAGQPETEEQQLCRQLIRVLAVFWRRMSIKPPPLKNILQKNFRKSRFRTAVCNDFENQRAMMQSRETIELPVRSFCQYITPAIH